jgi:hypothetical protein
VAICLGNLGYHFFRLIRLGKPRDLARPSGSESAGILYSFTQGMNPAHKESAYLHLPTYTAGLMYHAGTFLSVALLILSFFISDISGLIPWILAICLCLSCFSGLFILIKRVTVRKLRTLSNPDDYFSNILVTLFQAMTVTYLLIGHPTECPYYLCASLLFLYMPLGKLKHLVYFFAARYQLGLFFGRRGVWR